MTRTFKPIKVIVPELLAVRPHDALCKGWCRVDDTTAADIGSFLRVVIGAMADGAICRTHTRDMQQVVAAAACIEIARALSPALGRFLESLCFPDEGNAETLGRNLERYAPDVGGVRCLTTGEAMLPDVGLAAPQAEPHHARSCAVLDGDAITLITVDHGSPLGSVS